MDGATGPSGLDTASWKRLCTSFKFASADLCEALPCAYLERAGSILDVVTECCCDCFADDALGGLSYTYRSNSWAFIQCDQATKADSPLGFTKVVQCLRAVAANQSGCKAAIHAMRQIFESQDIEAVLLVDAFNALNRQVSLRNVLKLCPSLAKILINTYREDIQLFINGETLLSQEGTTQGDPLAMAMYAITITPLIHHLENKSVEQAWYADDATAGGNINDLKTWWDDIEKTGPDYGYHTNASKTWLIVKENHLEAAKAAFQGTEVQIHN